MEHRARKLFLVFPRPSKKFKHLYYVQFRLSDGSLTSPHSTGRTSVVAETWAVEHLKDGLGDRRGAVDPGDALGVIAAL
jgi:hypothetical protein